ncbi:MAG: RidA family protein [Hyphomicrobiales bacterium]|nr:RidA family protein [Hyphomicrobiales bacterium]
MQDDIRTRLKEMGLSLPQPPAPAAAYQPWRVHGDWLFVSGQGPLGPQGLTAIGQVGKEVSLDEARAAAQLAALNVLAHALAAADAKERRLAACLRLAGFVQCGADFGDHPKVIDGASDLINRAMGEAGQHARIALGAPSLPFNMAVEVEALFALA